MNILIGYVIIYFSIIFGSVFISSIFNKKIELCIGIDIIVKMILLYLFGLVGFLEIGTIAVTLISVILGIFAIIFYKKKINIKENVLTYGMFFFTIVYFGFMIFTVNKVSEVWDEYSYWSIASKKMFYTNNLVNDGLVIIYPPFPTILQYYFNKMVGEYNQGREIFANIILGLSLLLPLFSKVKRNNYFSRICLSLIIICIPAIFKEILLYQVIYTDAVLGLLIGYVFFVLYNEKDDIFKLISLLIGFIGITFTKPTGFYLALILVIVITIYYVLINLYKKNKNDFINIIKDKKNLIFSLISIIIVVVAFYSTYYIYSNGYVGDKDIIGVKFEELSAENFNTVGEALGTIKTTIIGSNDDSFYDDTSNRKLIECLIQIDAIKYPIKISIFAFAILYGIVNVIIFTFKIKKSDNKYIFIDISIAIGFIIYILFLQVAYITKFWAADSINHASLERYANTYLLAMFILLLSKILELIENGKEKYKCKYLILTLTILSMTQLNVIVDSTIASGNYNATLNSYFIDIREETDYLKNTLSKEDRIYIVNQESDKYPSTLELKYYLYPEIEVRASDKISKDFAKTFREYNLYEIWKDMLYKQYDYVYVYKTDEYFNFFAKDAFVEEKINEKSLYKIEKNQEEKEIKLTNIYREKKGDNNEKD
ncbi:MAG: hypothetical protein J6M60_04450 [Clostridia bacterium]|nr:hypothetical protein [Clostridia bacterium]